MCPNQGQSFCFSLYKSDPDFQQYAVGIIINSSYKSEIVFMGFICPNKWLDYLKFVSTIEYMNFIKKKIIFIV
jgi:hypothetical protein